MNSGRKEAYFTKGLALRFISSGIRHANSKCEMKIKRREGISQRGNGRNGRYGREETWERRDKKYNCHSMTGVIFGSNLDQSTARDIKLAKRNERPVMKRNRHDSNGRNGRKLTQQDLCDATRSARHEIFSSPLPAAILCFHFLCHGYWAISLYLCKPYSSRT
jgi:hypothetical protein